MPCGEIRFFFCGTAPWVYVCVVHPTRLSSFSARSTFFVCAECDNNAVCFPGTAVSSVRIFCTTIAFQPGVAPAGKGVSTAFFFLVFTFPLRPCRGKNDGDHSSGREKTLVAANVPERGRLRLETPKYPLTRVLSISPPCNAQQTASVSPTTPRVVSITRRSAAIHHARAETGGGGDHTFTLHVAATPSSNWDRTTDGPHGRRKIWSVRRFTAFLSLSPG